MRSFSRCLAAVALCLLPCSCTPAPLPGTSEEPPVENTPEGDNTDPKDNDDDNNTESMTINIFVGDKVFKSDIEDSETGKAFIGKLPLTLDMSELNGNEKYCYGVSLPRADKYYNSIAAGDLMLYSGSCIVLFYGSAGGFSYTRIGKLRSTSGLASALGGGSVTVKFEKE